MVERKSLWNYLWPGVTHGFREKAYGTHEEFNKSEYSSHSHFTMPWVPQKAQKWGQPFCGKSQAVVQAGSLWDNRLMRKGAELFYKATIILHGQSDARGSRETQSVPCSRAFPMPSSCFWPWLAPDVAKESTRSPEGDSHRISCQQGKFPPNPILRCRLQPWSINLYIPCKHCLCLFAVSPPW